MSVIVFYKTPIFEAIRPIFTQTTKKKTANTITY